LLRLNDREIRLRLGKLQTFLHFRSPCTNFAEKSTFKMKKILFALTLALAMTVCPQAQAETRWGVTAGLNYNTIRFKQTDLFSSKAQLGADAGVTGVLQSPGGSFGIEASLLYSMRNGKLNLGEKKVWSSQGLGNETCMLHYIDIPINLKYRFNRLNGFENTLTPIVFAGPVITFLAGHNKLDDQLSYSKVSANLQFGIGGELFNKVEIKAGYRIALGETLRTQLLDENTAKNRTFFLTATYYFK
jgi:hypothetical protein